MQIQVLIIIQVATFVALLVVLRFVFYNQLSAALIRLKRLHEENLAIEEKLKMELEEARKEKEKELARAKEESAAIIEAAKVKAEKFNRDVQGQAKQEAQVILEKGRASLEKLRKELHEKHESQSIELAVEMIQSIFSEDGKDALQHQLISETIDEIKSLEAERFTQKTGEVKVSSAYPLTKDEKEKLIRVLSEKLGAAVKLQESQNQDIIVGLIIKVGALIIDSSLRNKLRKVIPLLKGELKNGGTEERKN